MCTLNFQAKLRDISLHLCFFPLCIFSCTTWCLRIVTAIVIASHWCFMLLFTCMPCLRHSLDLRPMSCLQESSEDVYGSLTLPTSVHRWLLGLNMLQYEALFKGQGWEEISDVRGMQHEDLMRLGITNEKHVTVLWNNVRLLQRL